MLFGSHTCKPLRLKFTEALAVFEMPSEDAQVGWRRSRPLLPVGPAHPLGATAMRCMECETGQMIERRGENKTHDRLAQSPGDTPRRLAEKALDVARAEIHGTAI